MEVVRTVFLRCPRLLDAGFDHGFGTRYSRDREVTALATARQIHGTMVVEASLDGAVPEADALWTREPGVAVGVYTADCVPILLADRRSGVVAAVHAGWRGSAAGIARVAVDTLVRKTPARALDLWAVIGPHIGVCCYEVDAPVVAEIQDRDVLRPSRRSERFMLDLFELNRRQLIGAGVPAACVWRVAGCTFCDASFDSYRRDGTGGRMRHYVRARLARLDTEKR